MCPVESKYTNMCRRHSWHYEVLHLISASYHLHLFLSICLALKLSSLILNLVLILISSFYLFGERPLCSFWLYGLKYSTLMCTKVCPRVQMCSEQNPDAECDNDTSYCYAQLSGWSSKLQQIRELTCGLLTGCEYTHNNGDSSTESNTEHINTHTQHGGLNADVCACQFGWSALWSV